MRPRIFTVSEANRQIPRVQKIVSRIEEWQPKLLEIRERLAESGETGPPAPGDRVRLSHELERAEHEVIQAMQELEEIGCLLKQGGLVDFFTVKHGVLYELCWHSGEDEIRFYHEFNEGAKARQPLTPGDIASMGVGYDGREA
jgi:hypothetical protein